MVAFPTRDAGVRNVDSGAALPVASEIGAFGNLLSLPKTRLFGTDGIRGKAGELLTAPLALAVGFWAGQVLRTSSPCLGPVILGQDSRNSSDMLSMSLAAGLTSAGLEVWNVGLCPTPCVAYLTAQTRAVGGIMISASHNPPEDNGIKFFGSDGTKLAQTYTDQIEVGLRGMAERSFPVVPWGRHHSRQSLVDEYLQSLQRSLPVGISLQGLRIVLDLAWGAAVDLAPRIFRMLGAEIVCLHDQPDGDRINVGCGSTHLELLQTAVQQSGADLGFAFDGDADRVMAVDAQGRIVDGDYILYFWGQTLKATGRLPGDLLVATVMANLGFERAWTQLGGKLIRTPVGDQHVQAQMLKSGAMLGGEQSGHVICHHYSHTGDGLQTAVHLACLLQKSRVSLAELVDQSFRPYPQLLRNVRVEDCDRRDRWQECAPLQQAIEQAQAAMGDRGRVLVRASGTEPLIRVMVEAAELSLAQHWSEQLVKTVRQYLVE